MYRIFQRERLFRRYLITAVGATNSPNSFLNPTLNSYYHVLLQQQLLAGFGFGTEPALLQDCKEHQKISDEAFKLQVISTVTQIANMYWDLVARMKTNR